MLNEEMSAGTNAEQSTNDETRLPSSPTIGNTPVVRSPNIVSAEYDGILVSHGFNKNEHGTYVLCHKETEYKFYLCENSASVRVVWQGCPMPSIFHGMSVDNVDELNYLIKNVLVKIPTFLAKAPTDI